MFNIPHEKCLILNIPHDSLVENKALGNYIDIYYKTFYITATKTI